jgi:hypothetical protein
MQTQYQRQQFDYRAEDDLFCRTNWRTRVGAAISAAVHSLKK